MGVWNLGHHSLKTAHFCQAGEGQLGNEVSEAKYCLVQVTQTHTT